MIEPKKPLLYNARTSGEKSRSRHAQQSAICEKLTHLYVRIRACGLTRLAADSGDELTQFSVDVGTLTNRRCNLRSQTMTQPASQTVQCHVESVRVYCAYRFCCRVHRPDGVSPHPW